MDMASTSSAAAPVVVRTVTVFIPGPVAQSNVLTGLAHAAALGERARALLVPARVVQTVRVALPPVDRWLLTSSSDSSSSDEAVWSRLEAVAAECERLHIQYLSLGLVSASLSSRWHDLVIRALIRWPMFNAPLQVPYGNVAAADAATDAVLRLATDTPHGTGNFRMCTVSNVPPGSPFFPASYADADSDRYGVGMGLESVPLLVAAVARGTTTSDHGLDDTGSSNAAVSSLCQALLSLPEHLEAVFADEVASLVAAVAPALDAEKDIMLGVDVSINPSIAGPDGPAPAYTLTEAFERVGAMKTFGEAGTLATTEAVTRGLKRLVARTDIPTCGYCGVMLPVCEDGGLAAAVRERRVRSVSELLFLSAVCGCGLDCVPLPGDVPRERVRAAYLDVAAMAHRLGKPLGARLFPVPGTKGAHQPTSFNHPFLTESVTMEI